MFMFKWYSSTCTSPATTCRDNFQGDYQAPGDLWEADLHCQGAVDEQEVRALLGGAGQHYTSLTCPGE